MTVHVQHGASVDETAHRARPPSVPGTSRTGVTPDRLCAALSDAQRSVHDLERSHDEIVAAARDANADDEHDPEGATIAFEREQVAALLAQARRRVDELRSALERTAAGTYGRCESCGQAIGEPRLEARPAATTCIACASRR